MLRKHSIVCQTPGAAPYTIRAYNGTDLSGVLGINQVDMPDDHYGWIQVCGNGIITVSGETQLAYADFRPNEAKHHLSEDSTKHSQQERPEPVHSAPHEESFNCDKRDRLSQLPPLLIEVGQYCSLLREARDVFVDGHFYACVAMCGIAFERFQRDKAQLHGAMRKHKIWQVRDILRKKAILKPEALILCERMADLRNRYAHGDGLNPKEDALDALEWMHSFIDNETTLMRGFSIVDGALIREQAKTA